MYKISELEYSQEHIQRDNTIHVILDRNFNFVSVTQHAANLCGYAGWEKMLGTTVFDFPCAVIENSPEFHRQDRKVIESEQPMRVLNINEYVDGELKFFLTQKKPLFSKDNQVIGLETFNADLQQRSSLSQFCLALYKNSLYMHKQGKFSGLSYEIIDQYDDLNLTKRQSEILFLLGYGKTAKDIAKLIYISSRTVEHHINEIRYLLNIGSKSALIEFAIISGLIFKVPLSLI